LQHSVRCRCWGCHAYWERVEDPAEVGPAIERGLRAVQSGQAAVLDVVLAPISALRVTGQVTLE